MALAALRLAADDLVVDSLDGLRSKAELRGQKDTMDLLTAEGGSLSGEGLATALHLSRESVNAWRQQGKLIAWQKGVRNFQYPAWQVCHGAVLPGLAAVLEILRKKQMTPIALVDYFLSESEELDGSPLDLLRRGQVEDVVMHANRYGETGT